MFTFKPASKNGVNSNGNGHTNGNGSSNGNGNGHSNGSENNGNGHTTGTGTTTAVASGNGHSPLSGWLGLVNGQKNGSAHKNGNGHGHSNGNGHSNKVESVLGPGIHFQGNFSGAGGIRIEGTFDGTITVKGPVVVADGAKVTADIQALSVTVAGSVQGNITASRVEIRSTGRIFGDLVTTAFATEEGAFLRGQVRMEDEITAPAPAQLAAPTAVLSEPAMVSSETPVEVAA
jgi:cytoskeletal protein CcmA (bactofilin family)